MFELYDCVNLSVNYKIVIASSCGYKIYDIDKFEGSKLVKFLKRKTDEYIISELEKGPGGRVKCDYGILLIIALKRGLDVQCAEKWGRT